MKLIKELEELFWADEERLQKQTLQSGRVAHVLLGMSTKERMYQVLHFEGTFYVCINRCYTWFLEGLSGENIRTWKTSKFARWQKEEDEARRKLEESNNLNLLESQK